MGQDPIGSIGGLPGLREPIPFYALHFRAGPGGSNSGTLTLLLDDELSAIMLSTAIAAGGKSPPRVLLTVGQKEYGLRNVRLRPVNSKGELGLSFNLSAELDSLIAAARVGIHAHSPFWHGGRPEASDRDTAPDRGGRAAMSGARGPSRSSGRSAH
jgi:hypothetical protein